MNRAETREKLTLIFREQFKNELLVLTDDLSASDVPNWDSLTHMILISAIEERFLIKFKLKDLNKMRNVGDMIEIIVSKLSA